MEHHFQDFKVKKMFQQSKIVLRKHLKKITNQNCRINYSGRTDAGVHALSQVCDFETTVKRTDKEWINGINSNLPQQFQLKIFLKFRYF